MHTGRAGKGSSAFQALIGRECSKVPDMWHFAMDLRDLFQYGDAMARRRTPNQGLTPYQRPRDDQIIVWVDDDGEPAVIAIFDKILMPSSATKRDTYKAFVQRFGAQVADRAVRLFQTRAED